MNRHRLVQRVHQLWRVYRFHRGSVIIVKFLGIWPLKPHSNLNEDQLNKDWACAKIISEEINLMGGVARGLDAHVIWDVLGTCNVGVIRAVRMAPLVVDVLELGDVVEVAVVEVVDGGVAI